MHILSQVNTAYNIFVEKNSLNLCAKHAKDLRIEQWMDTLNKAQLYDFALCIKPGLENSGEDGNMSPVTVVGCYALEAQHYEMFQPFWSRGLRQRWGSP